jgi:hypothetical protein
MDLSIGMHFYKQKTSFASMDCRKFLDAEASMSAGNQGAQVRCGFRIPDSCSHIHN